MPRSLRYAPGGWVYHVVNRGNDRRTIFENDADFAEFRRLLGDAAARTPMRLCGYSAMRNHFHLVLWPSEDGALSAYMHWVTTCHSLHWRRRNDSFSRGHVFQGRYRSFPVETSGYYYNVLKYVEANPLRAGLVSRAEDWRWSSLFERVHGRSLISNGPLELPANWVDIVNAGHDTGELEALRLSAARGRPYGTNEWVDQAAATLGLERTLRARGRPRVRECGVHSVRPLLI